MDKKKITPNVDEELLTARESAKKEMYELSDEELAQVSGGATGDGRDVVENADNMYALLDDVDGWDATL